MSDLLLVAALAAAWVGLIAGARLTRPGGGWSAAVGAAGLMLALLIGRILLDRGAPWIGLLTATLLGLAWMVICPRIRRIRYRAF